MNISAQSNRDEYWSRKLGKTICFATAFNLGKHYDLASIAKDFPEGVVLCDPGMVAGIEHAEAVLTQTKEYLDRNQRLVRNGSLEILMRITCQRQISEAINASRIVDTDVVALLGLASSEIEIENSIKRLSALCKEARMNKSLLALTKGKAANLKKFHRLPKSLSMDKLQTALQERSVLLMFSK